VDQELVTRFTADISQYKKSMASLQADLKQLSGVTDKIKTVTAKAMSSASSDTRKMGKQVDTLIKSQERNVQAAMSSAAKISEYTAKARQLKDQLHSQDETYKQLSSRLKEVTATYRAQQEFLKSYKNGIAGVSSQYQEMVDWIHKMETASTSGMTINQIEQQRAAINRIKNDLEVFDGELKEVGLNPNNLKTDSLDKLKNEIRKTSSQILKTKSAMSQTTAQINKTNADIATESTRFSNLKSSISRNAPALKSMSKQLKQTGDVSAAGKLKKGFSGLKGIFGNIGSAAGGIPGRDQRPARG